MQTGEVGLSIMIRPPREIAPRSESFAAHPLVFIAQPGHPLLKTPQATVSALAPCACIVRARLGWRSPAPP